MKMYQSIYKFLHIKSGLGLVGFIFQDFFYFYLKKKRETSGMYTLIGEKDCINMKGANSMLVYEQQFIANFRIPTYNQFPTTLIHFKFFIKKIP